MLVNIHTHRPSCFEITVISRGIHPWDAFTADFGTLEKSMPAAEVIGEIGIDKACKVDLEVQTKVFERQLQMAQEYRKPVVIHCVRAFEPIMQILNHYNIPSAIFHGFIGSSQQMWRAVERGYYISYGFKSLKSRRTIEALCQTPDNSLFLETDTENESITMMYAYAATFRHTDIDTLERATLQNLKTVLRQ